MKKSKSLLLCLCLAMAFTGVTATMASCDDSETSDSSSVNSPVEFEADGTYYAVAGSEEYTVVLNDGAFELKIAGETISGSYTYDGEIVTMKQGDAAIAEAVQSGANLIVTYQGSSYTFFAKVDYTVSFSVDGQINEAMSQTVCNGKTATKPTAPTKADYSFVGWYLDETFKTPYTFNEIVSGNVTIYARFIKTDATKKEFKITYVVDGETFATAQTTNGGIYDCPVPAKDGKTFIGWWTSDFDDAAKLTAQIQDGAIVEENTTLYAVWKSESPVISITATGATWTDMGVGSQYTVIITSPNGAPQVIPSASNKYDFDFTTQAAGEYTITVSVNGQSATAYYNNKKLAKVTHFEEVDGVITFNKVANATNYYITVECGDETHSHVDIDLGDNAAFDFSNCAMPEDGIKFVVKAAADGYIASTSEEYVIIKKLAAVEDVAVTADEITWTAVENATAYTVTITAAGETAVYTVNGTSFNLKDYAAGDIAISVVAEAFGYVASDATEITYAKASLAAPAGLTLNGETLTWTAVENATGYIVKIGENTYETATNAFEFTADNIPAGVASIEVSVMAKAADAANNSQYSNATTVTFGAMAADSLAYAAGQISWGAVLNAQKYEVQVNDGEIIEIANTQTTADITFDKAGMNTIKVRCYDANGTASEWVSTQVEAYAIYLLGNGGLDQTTIYKATGDSVTPVATTRKGYTFSGWYDMPIDGKKYAETFTFTGNSATMLYAGWTANKYVVKMYAAYGDAEPYATQEVTYDSNYELPTVEYSDPNALWGFSGWYTEANGAGIRYTNESGANLAVFKDDREVVLYASFNEFLRFEEVLNLEGEYTYQVVGGKDIDLLETVTVPVEFNGKKVTRLGGGAFQDCRNIKEIYLPDTIEYIEFGDGGYSGIGNAFYYCKGLTGVYIYETEGTHKRYYQSGNAGSLIYTNNITNEKTLVFVPQKTEYITIDEGVEVIGQNVFASTEVIEVIVPASVKRIESGAFYYCDTMTTLTFLEAEDGVSASLEISTDTRTFQLCSKLSNLTLPSHLNRDTDFTVFDSSYRILAEIKVDATAEKGGFYAVDGILCYGQGADATMVYVPCGFAPENGEYTIPANIYKIGDYAFNKVNELSTIQTLNIGGHVTYIGEGAFAGIESIKYINFLATADATTTIDIGAKAFYACTSITSLTMPINMGTLGANAFGGIVGLSKVSIDVKNSAMSLAANAFATPSGEFTVSELEIGANTSTFEVAAVFGGRIATLTVDPENQHFEEEADVLFNKGKTAVVYVSATKSGEYAIPAGVETINANVFENRNVSKVTIPASVTTIANDAFANCQYLEEIIFETAETEQALNVGANAFAGSARLTKITIGTVTGISLPDRTTDIGEYAFSGTGISGSLELPANLTMLSAGAYANTGVTSVTISEGLTNIPMGTEKDWLAVQNSSGSENLTLSVFNMFAGCNELASIEVDAKNTNYVAVDGILYSVADGNATLLYAPAAMNVENITIGATITANGSTYNVTEVASYAFRNMKYVKTITFADSDTAITFNDRAFAYDSFAEEHSIEEIKLPVGTETISKQMFYNCTGLVKVNVPYTVTTIDTGAFFNNYALNEITFDATPADKTAVGLVLADGGAVKTSGSTAGDPNAKDYVVSTFYGCTSLKEVILPERTTKIGMGVFYTGMRGDYINNVANPNWKFGIEKVYIPASVTEIGSHAFAAHTYDTGCIKTIEIAEDSQLEKIGSYAFSRSGITQFIMPASVTSLGKYAFKESFDLEKVVCSSQIPEISQSAFENCTSLSDFSFTAGESKLVTISTTTFKDTALKSFTVPATVQVIKANAFTSCFDLETVIFDTYKEGEKAGKSDLAELTNQVFNYCPKLTNVVFPETTGELVFTTSTSTFVACQNLKTVTLPSTVTSIENVFTSCGALEEIIISPNNQNLKLDGAIIYNDSGTAIRYCYAQIEGDAEGTYTIASGVKEIGYGAFMGMPNIKKLIIPNTVETIATYAFAMMPDLEEVVFEAGNDVLTIFPTGAFYDCAKLKHVTMPDHLISMAGSNNKSTSYAFYGCASLEEIELPDTLQYMGGYMFTGSGVKKVTIPENVKFTTYATGTSVHGAYLFSGASELEEIEFANPENATALPSRFAVNCPKLKTLKGFENVAKISGYAFQNCTSLEEIDLSNVTLLYTYVFDGCTSLKNVTFGDGLTQMGGSATSITNSSYVFRNTAIEHLVLPASLNILTASNFTGCQNLKTVDLGGVTKIGNYSFKDCPNLTTINGLENVTQIGNQVFVNCTSMTSIDISNVGTLGTQLFDGCTALSEVKLNDNTTSLGYYMFRNCTSLKQIELPSALTSLGTGETFYGSGITSIKIPAGVTTIDYWTFANCKDLESVEFLGKVTSIGAEAFMDCPKLSSVKLGNVVSDIGAGAFQNCVSLEEIALPATLSSIGNYAFKNTGIKSLHIPVALSYIGAGAYLDCPNLTADAITITTGGVFTKGEDGMLYDLTGSIVWAPADLAQVDGLLQDGVLTVDSTLKANGSPFSGNTTITKIVVQEGVTEIPAELFRGIANVTEVVLPEGLVTIGNYAFADCAKLVNINIPSTVKSIGDYAFFNTTSAIQVDMSNATSLTTLGKGAFEKSGIESITLPAGITHLPQRLFYDATSFSSFSTLGEIKTIGEDGYSLVFAYTKVTEFDASKLEVVGQTAFLLSDIKELHFGENLVEIGDCAIGGIFTDSSKESFGGVERFNAEMSKVEVVTFADNGKLTVLGNSTQGSVFSRLPNLKKVVLPNTLLDWGPYTFVECVSLEEVVIPEGLEWMGEYTPGSMYQTTGYNQTFYGCTSLKTITLPSTMKNIPSEAFSGCINLETINIPEGLLVIGDEAFKDCAKLTNITMPKSIYVIGSGAFSGCTSIASMTIAKNTYVKGLAFEGWTAEQTVNFVGDKYSVCVQDVTALNNTNANIVFNYTETVGE